MGIVRDLSFNIFKIILFFPIYGLSNPVHFKEMHIKVGGHSILAEIAETPEQQERGLMYRKKLASDRGMLFVFPSAKILNFWMKNTFIPLSIGFFDSEGVLIEFLDMEPVTSEIQTNLPTYSSSRPARFALEVPRGWFKKKNIKPGAKISYPLYK